MVGMRVLRRFAGFGEFWGTVSGFREVDKGRFWFHPKHFLCNFSSTLPDILWTQFSHWHNRYLMSKIFIHQPLTISLCILLLSRRSLFIFIHRYRVDYDDGDSEEYNLRDLQVHHLSCLVSNSFLLLTLSFSPYF